MTKEEVLQHVQGVIDAPSAYAGLKDVAKDYLASVGKADEKAKAEKLIAALNECVERSRQPPCSRRARRSKPPAATPASARPAPTANSCSTIGICYWDELRETCNEGKCVYISEGAGACILASSLR